jgi:signal transduction histidine kinase
MNAKPNNRPGFGFTVPTDRDELAELGKIAGVLVHELKNPIGIILLNAELMQNQISPSLSTHERDREVKRLQRIIDSAKNVQNVVQSFLSFARPGHLDPDAVNVNSLILSLLDEQAELFEQAAISVSFHPDENLQLLAADKAHLRSIFLNVITNAREALLMRKEDRRLLVVTRGGKNVIRIVIANNGPPFDERIESHLFQPFSTSKDDGTGLGLAIVKRLVELHHGTVTASSDASRGVSFTFEFPTTLGPAKARTELPLPTVEARIRSDQHNDTPPQNTALAAEVENEAKREGQSATSTSTSRQRRARAAKSRLSSTTKNTPQNGHSS